MKRYKTIWRMQFVTLLAIAAIVSFSFTVNAAEQPPYEYTFEKDAGVQFNGIDGVKRIKMTFYDKNLLASDIVMNKNVYVLQGTKKVNIINPIIVDSNTVTISFKNLQYLDYSAGALDYKLVIEKDAKLHFDQLTDYTVPFKIHEILPGFESVFIKSPAETINMNVFKNNAPIDVAIHVPKMYLTEIKTTHRYKGVADLPNPNMESHSLTNMDVIADPEATRLKVSVNNEEQYARDLVVHPVIKGFTLGQAGLEALVCEGQNTCTGTAKDFHLTAYNEFGKVLTNRNFKVKVVNKTNGFTVNDYLTKPDKIFGQKTTLRALMEDSKLLNTIVTRIPVTELDTLGVIYSLGSKTEVANHEQLLMALENEAIKTITLTNSIMGDVNINRSVTIDGDSNSISGNVTLNKALDGKDVVARLKNTRVSKDLTIDVDAGGSAILEGTHVDGFTTVTSGSLHMFNFTAPNGIDLHNTSPMRVVIVNSTPNMTLHSDKEVTFVGTYGVVTVNNPNAKLTIKSNTEIEKIIVNQPNKLTLTKPRDKAIPLKEGTGDIVVIDTEPIEGEGGQTISEWYYPELLSQSIEAWQEIGVRPVFDKFPMGIDWKVANPNVFGGQSQVLFNDGLLQIVDVFAAQTKEVVLQGVLGGQMYRVTILVEIDLQ